MSEVEIKNEFIIDNNSNVDVELGNQNQVQIQSQNQQPQQSYVSRIFKYLFFENFIAKKIFGY